MNITDTIAAKLAVLSPLHLDILNESHMHAGPAADSHFKLVVVSDEFGGKRLVARHQRIYQLLAEELAGPVHALSLHLYSPQEWRDAAVPTSPPCQGGH